MVELENLRKEIDIVDNELLKLIQKRFEVVEKIWKYKKEKWIPIVQKDRWDEVLEKKLKIARNYNLNEELIANIWNNFHEVAIKNESNC